MTMKAQTYLGVLAAAVALAAGPALAQQAAPAPAPATEPPKPAAIGMFVYPGSGQDAAQQAKDEGECYAWARTQTGIDPTAPPTQAAAAEVPKGGTVKGAARGAAGGTVVGAIVGETGEGAAVGAVAGAARGRRAQKKAEKQAKQQAQQAAQTTDAQAKDTFKKAWGACLEGRGYSVK
jgi:OmpA family protein